MSKELATKSISEKTLTHPCYNCIAHKYARMHIPVAPKCNVSCNFCNRKYDCVNETRPGVTSEVLTPEGARDKFKIVRDKVRNLTVVGIAGPGDPLANFDETKKSIELIKKESKDITFCLSTNGLMLSFYADKLIELGVTHLTVTINAVDPKIGGKVYKFVNYLGDTFVGEEAGRVLLNNQLSGLKYAAQKGIVCKVNIVMIKGINDLHIPEIVKKVKECGAYMTNIMPLIPVKGSVFENNPTVTEVELNDMRRDCELTLKQMYHCRQCRADAIGTLDNDVSGEFRESTESSQNSENNLEDKNVIQLKSHKYRFAVASKSGVSIDEHFGHATEFYIYDVINDEIKFKEKRKVNRYCSGGYDCGEHEDRIENIIKSVIDCNAVLVVRAGFEPIDRLHEKGIRLFQMYQEINEGIRKAAKLLKKDE
ncbi:nitrogenase cofactor biosynthesis protein NifB [Clostridium autoethanogenum]|uniref:FeMo cofactor biosynthesis protein NifB n=1 Tax=Clostridium autoethanogenum DSM 10061 TaxID=1341692 RepID=A0ABN4BFD3_9CLOT|nr:nitrogenase cofactor biosynthesis protein NifB [Clostridium autoethanogenum]AGY74647.1 nitrogenase cofactor biosynthesis protein NifB [Clostridium autoethanogenum DSM 10061]ALU34829.1 Nitrogenase cofactor biosynthesis protein nifB [Clostridium autoethanogenum DSM 10061]OVY51550.1 FeMo cofactor biosynthesis protein NifB [Clostridium autoethanogenum]